MKPRGSLFRRLPLLLLWLPLIAACGGTSDDAPRPASALEQQGQLAARELGCASCHGLSGNGGVGPAWTGLAGASVTLADGSTVLADREYLRRSITEPQSQVVAGFNVTMPTVEVSPDQLDALVAYIEGLPS